MSLLTSAKMPSLKDKINAVPVVEEKEVKVVKKDKKK
jgi:hypothetical protein